MAKNKNKKMVITKEQILKINKKISRDIEIENGLNICHKRVHKSTKDYNRQVAKKILVD